MSVNVPACLPDWAQEGKSCPYGSKSGLLLGNWTWPDQGVTWIHYIGAFYSFMPMLVIFGILIYGLWTRGVRELFAFIFQGLTVVVMTAMKLIIKQRRPVGSCSVTCGMPSGHTVATIGTFVWIALEVWAAKCMEPKQKALVLGVAGLLLIPVGWSRVLFHDHSWDQVLVGAVVGTLLAVIWYGFLTSRLAWWLIKLLKAWVPFVEVNYPIDGMTEEAPWAPQAPPADYGTRELKSQ
ncbi:unnamed protein product [Durusdinium trenchii]|uniref:Phosphatidic acid phosphatase type 2/haloperoxidase domain-containing protein n=2 Tax=Durusdinium trenchii TaxID=1381693 RepID=A0ABP0HJP4_9DINO